MIRGEEHEWGGGDWGGWEGGGGGNHMKSK